MMGFLASVVNPKPKDLSVALVVKDQGVKIEGATFNFGESIQEDLMSQKSLPIKWIEINDRKEALNGLGDGKYYGLLHIPEGTSKNILSLLQPGSQKPMIELVVNEGSQYTAANTTEQIMNDVITGINENVQLRLVQEINEQGLTLNTEQLTALLNPLDVNREVINEVGDNTANGNLPVLLTQILWLSIFIGSVILFLIIKKVYAGQRHLCSVSSQIVGGLLFVATIVTTMLLFARGILNVDISDFNTTFLFMLFVGIVFFFIQNALLNWIGLIASPVILLLFLFSIPVLNFPSEFLPPLTNTLLYSWIPLRFSVEGLREILFFDETSLTSAVTVLSWIGIGGLVVMSLSILKDKNKKSSMENNQTTENSLD